MARQGADRIRELELDERPFATLDAADRYFVLNAANWLAIQVRAEQLSLVPRENVKLVLKHGQELKELLPPSLFEDPFEGLYPRPQDYGIPFQEGTLSDAKISWDSAEAIIGTDPPDDDPQQWFAR